MLSLIQVVPRRVHLIDPAVRKALESAPVTKSGRHLATLLVIAAIAGARTVAVKAQAPIDISELADYRLTAEVFERFGPATRRIVAIARDDAAFTYAPLFTKDVALSGDAVAAASALVARLEYHPGLAAALEASNITPREYAKFAITLVAAHLAHGFVKAGVMRGVPPGAPSVNVEFVKTHESDVMATLTSLGILD